MLHYLASPYTSDDKRVQDARYQIALTACALLIKQGLSVYSPIVHWHVVAEQYSDIPYDCYLANDLQHLQNCDVLLVLTSAGWLESAGVQTEIARAKELDLLIKYFSPTTGEITYEPRSTSN